MLEETTFLIDKKISLLEVEEGKRKVRKTRVKDLVLRIGIIMIGLFSFIFILKYGVLSRIIRATDEAVKGENIDWIKQSRGCGKPTKYKIGKTQVVNLADITYLIHVPKAPHYAPDRPLPIVMSHGGWGLSAQEDSLDSGLSGAAEKYGFIAVFAQGYSDNYVQAHPKESWYSFNTIGSTGSTAENPTCESWAGSSNYCYQSCAERCDERGCYWTTCRDSIEAANIILNDVEAKTCIDLSREYVSGQSNGGIFSMRLGAELSHRLAAIAPVSATFTHGFIGTPKYPMPIFDVVGSQDHTVPVNRTNNLSNYALSSDGWRYEPLENVFELWAQANLCPPDTSSTTHFPTPFDNIYGLYCFGYDCNIAPTVRCVWDGAHTYFGNKQPHLHAELIWFLLSSYINPYHIGFGQTITLADNEIPRKQYVPSTIIDNTLLVKQHKEEKNNEVNLRRKDCDSNETLLSFTYGARNASVCAPRIQKCLSPGMSSHPDNGCPYENQVCLSISGAFHCFDTCSPRASSSCSLGASCLLGQLRTSNVGICAYEDYSFTTSGGGGKEYTSYGMKTTS
mmetsp:Transcript_2623/g.4177  ORF Transcript_2623/g.4177 Transcript_2623/m.4177 type:complete len:565 (+) Transcript_2623:59-1753(+)